MTNRLWILFVITACIGFAAHAQTGEYVDVRSGINHDEFDRLLKKYVNERGLVNYGAWKENAADISALDNYLKPHIPQKAVDLDEELVNNHTTRRVHRPVAARDRVARRWVSATRAVCRMATRKVYLA